MHEGYGVLTRIERVIRRDPRLHSDTEGGGGEKGGREGEHALYFLIYPPLPISSRCIRKLTSILSGFTLHIVSRADSIARIKKLATPTLFS